MQLEGAYAVEITKFLECVDRKLGRFTNADWQNTPTHHHLSDVTDSQTPQDRNKEWNKKYKGEQSRENKKDGKGRDVWKIDT
jgi:hypothetical protein